MSEESKVVYKYRIGNKFNFDGIVEIIERFSEHNGFKPAYKVRTTDGREFWVDTDWIDAGIEHFSQENAEYLRKLPDPIRFDNDKALDKQIGGDHYKKCKIQPVDYIHANGLDFFQGNIVKYITRFRDKGGRQDLEKIKHYCDMLIELEYPENAED